MSSRREPVLLTNDWAGALRKKRARERSGAGNSGQKIPSEGPFRVWQGEPVPGEPGTGDWVRRRTVREVNLELMEGRVVELSLEGTRQEGEGTRQEGEGLSPARQVVGFIITMYTQHGLLLWPRDGITIHTSEPSETENLIEAINSLMEIGGVELVVSENGFGRTHFNSGARRQTEQASGSRVSGEDQGGE